ncbi:MAG: hypothetical protein LBM74_09830 [Oscillospiraceae bacterium]|jgi:hypothetical protein|nr:hypothetical protein [Oscillospiraceae bacterium]
MQNPFTAPTPEAVLAALSALRAPRVRSEYDLHALVAAALSAAALPCLHEAALFPGRRIDFLCGTVGVEVKRGRPPARTVISQLTAYAKSPRIQTLVLVAEKLPRLPETVGGKPLLTVSLSVLWGVAL